MYCIEAVGRRTSAKGDYLNYAENLNERNYATYFSPAFSAAQACFGDSLEVDN